MPTPNQINWKGIELGDGDGLYNVDQDLKAVRATPVIERDDAGNIVRAVGSKRHVTQIRDAIERQGRKARITDGESQVVAPIPTRVSFPLDDDIKRLCVKMSVAATKRVAKALSLSSPTQAYLLHGVIGDICPVRLAIGTYAQLDAIRPLAGHLVYVRACADERRAYSVVQLFAAIQFFCELDNQYEGESLAIVATHDPLSHKEAFQSMSPLDYPLPDRYVQQPFPVAVGQRLEHLRLDLVKLFGDQAPESLSPNA
jgi:hypothetical protein